MHGPWDLAVSSCGLVYVPRVTSHSLQVFSSAGTLLHEISGLARPSGVAVLRVEWYISL